MKKLAPALVFLAVTGCNKPENAIVDRADSIGFSQDCAERALYNTTEAQAKISEDEPYAGSAISLGETSAHLNDTSIQKDENGTVTASGPGAKTALSLYNACVPSL